jgi:hypothetical protein
MSREVVLVVSVQDYLHRPLIDLARHLYGEDVTIIPMRAWRRIDKIFLLKLLFWHLPFRITRIFTPSDLGGRLVRVILDLAGLLGIECCVVPAHNHPRHIDHPLPLHRRYVDLDRPRVIGGFSRRTRLIMNDDSMRRFFLSMGYDPRRLVRVNDWIGALYRRPEPVAHPLVFFTEVIQEIDRRLFEANLARVIRLVESGLVPRLHVKLHPREPSDMVERYRRELGRFASVEFIAEGVTSLDVINRSAVIMASFSTVLLEALWLGKRVVVLENPVFRETMLAWYLDDNNHVLFTDDLDLGVIGGWCDAGPRRDRAGPGRT